MTDRPSDDITVIQGMPARQTDLKWIEYQLKEKQDTLKRLEDTAKYLSGLASVSLTILLAPNKEAFRLFDCSWLLKTGILCWLISILFTLAVLFPFRYKYMENSAQSIRTMFKRTTALKYTLLILGTFFYMAGICITVYMYLFA